MENPKSETLAPHASAGVRNLKSEIANILLVDDRPENLLALEAILADLGQNLVTADSGAAALRCALKQDFAVILLDVQMPDLDGFETAALIRERERSKHTPIIFITAVGKTETEVFRGYATGAVDYIFKPFDPTILKAKVQVFVDLYRTREQLRAYTERLEAEIAERQRAQTQLEVANRELEAFSHSVSHDLRAPLNHIQYFAQALAEDASAGLTDQAKDCLTRIQTSARRMSELMDDLLKLARVTRAELRRVPVNLSALARQIIQDLSQTEPARQVEWVVAEGLTAQGDPGLLKVVLENLLGNAWKYTSKQARARIEFGVAPAAEEQGSKGAAEQGRVSSAPQHPCVLRPRQRRRFQHGTRREFVRALSTLALPKRISRHRHRAVHRPARDSPPRRTRVGRSGRGQGRDVLFHARIAESKEQRAEGKERRAKSGGQRAKSGGQRAKSKGQRAKGKERRAKGKGQRAKSKGQRAKGKERRAKGKGHYALRSTLYALCPMLYALCSTLYALCPLLYALRSMLYALCSMLYATRPSLNQRRR